MKLRSGGEPGKVVSIDGKKVRLEIGNMQFVVKKNELFIANKPIETKSKSITTNTVSTAQKRETELDIRGYSKSEALDAIEEFLDNALMLNNVMQLKIIHGRGTGVLKKTLWKKAKEYKDINKIWHPEPDFGGEAVTYIRL